mmetsp:Transcript_7233/g.22273  ORF Transcript_7233/g.22273 Transcript_7233/m.22273 type:complete len:85 (-) Transcript_7233:118-372(-)
MCSMKELRADAGKRGPLRGVLSSGKEWIFAQLDDNNVLSKSGPLLVGYDNLNKAALRAVVRFSYAALRDARRAELCRNQSHDRD